MLDGWVRRFLVLFGGPPENLACEEMTSLPESEDVAQCLPE